MLYGKKTIEGKLLEDAHILMHPIRYRILELLTKKPMHIDRISRALNVKSGLVAYHLNTLQERGFVESNYGILILLELEQRGTALRVYTVTDKVADVKEELKRGFNFNHRQSCPDNHYA